MNNYITLYGEPLEYPHQVSVDKRGVAYYGFNMATERVRRSSSASSALAFCLSMLITAAAIFSPLSSCPVSEAVLRTLHR